VRSFPEEAMFQIKGIHARMPVLCMTEIIYIYQLMRIYTDIAHPSYAHALRLFISEMKGRGHEVLVSARDKDITLKLLDSWGIDYVNRGKGAGSLLGKFSYLIGVIYKLLPVVRDFRPDLVVSYSSYHAALTGKILGVPVITFEDTELVPQMHRVNRMLSALMVTPSCFEIDLGPNHVRFEGYKELASLYPTRFKPLPLPGSLEKPYIILRFVSWKAWHDKGHPGVGEKMKHIIAERLSVFGRVYILSEDPLSPGLSRYGYKGDCTLVHSMLAGASLFFGESASMASEAAMLGVPAIYIDNKGRGYTRELEGVHSLIYNFGEDEESVNKALNKAITLLGDPDLSEKWQKKRMEMLRGKIDLTGWMVELAERFPEHTDNNYPVQDRRDLVRQTIKELLEKKDEI
jgi:uncharacterized protein